MTLRPLIDAPLVIQIHAFAAMTAFAVGVVQLAAPKGTIPHRLIGRSWAALMLIVAISSFFIHQIRLWGPWSPIHLLSILVLVTLPLAVLHARRHDVRQHRMAMLMLFTGALGDRRWLHPPARPDYACGGVRPLMAMAPA